jgi:acetolactate synthase-1/2/3 large subunit
MKLSDYVINFLSEKGVTKIFGMSGGAAVHLFDSIAKTKGIDYVCSSHEQCAAISADGFARATGKLGVALTTSGPGATNLLTGTCCSYYDSIPTLMLTGQVSTPRLRGDRKVRQIGFQETDVVSIFTPVTKYAFQILDPKTIRFHLEKALYLAFEGRPGPVLIDIPDDLQRAEIEPQNLDGFSAPILGVKPNIEVECKKLVDQLKKSQRPVIVVGGGLKTPNVGGLLGQVLNKLGVPIVCSWAGLDLIHHDHPLYVGPFGVYGPRPGNFTVQNADFILSLGTRLSQNLTGGTLSSFAREAFLAVVDIDIHELNKFDGRGIDIDLKIESAASDFLVAIDSIVPHLDNQRLEPWRERILHWKKEYPLLPSKFETPGKYIDAYDFVSELSNVTRENELMYVDTGGNLTWVSNGITIKQGQSLFSAWNNTPMGYALPAAIGGAVAGTNRPVTCLTGDGGLLLCLGELSTVIRHSLPIKIILFNNHCHGIQKQTLETWLGGKNNGVDPASGLGFPDFPKVAAAMGFEVITIDSPENLREGLRTSYNHEGPIFINVEINPDQKLYPVVKFGEPLENQLPLLPSEVLKDEMIIPLYQKIGHK